MEIKKSNFALGPLYYSLSFMAKVFQILIFSLLFTFSSFAQNFNGKILDKTNGIALENTLIINLKTLDTTFSDGNGNFKIKESGRFKVKRIGYNEEIVGIELSTFKIIELTSDPSQLNEVIITANHLPKSLKKSTASIEVINQSQIQRYNNADFSPILNSTPGIFMQSGALNTNRITIRGIGARNLFGTSKIRAYFKDIPLTNGSGETTIEDFELGSLSEIEIIKGATSSSFGAGLGGTILLKPKYNFGNSTKVSSEFTVGSFGLIKELTNLNIGLNKNAINFTHSITASDGYRDNNDYNRNTFTLSSKHILNAKNDISVLASFVNLKAFIPSSLNESDFKNSPSSAAFTWGRSKGFEDSDRGIIGITWTNQLNENFQQVTSIFTSFRSNYEPRPFNILSENSFALGLRSRLLGSTALFKKKLNFTIGGEYFKDNYNYKTFDNLYEDFEEGTGSIQGNELSDFKEKRSYYNLFFESDYELSSRTTFTFGINLNKTSYDLEDRFEVSNNNPDQSGEFKFKSIVSPKFGLSHALTDYMHLFSSISQGFSPISLSETLLPNGQINQNLKPETGWNYEIGSRGLLAKGKLQYGISVYRLNISNLVVSRRTAQDEFIGINAGKTRHDGLELKLDYSVVSSDKLKINTYSNYTLNNFKFDEFVDEDSNFSGNDLTGVPSQVFNLGIDYSFNFGLYGNFNYRYVGEIPITDSNSLYSDAYGITYAKIGYEKAFGDHFSLNFSFGVNNLFDTTYASQILVNATGFNGAAPRYYYPENPINYYAAIRLNYVF